MNLYAAELSSRSASDRIHQLYMFGTPERWTGMQKQVDHEEAQAGRELAENQLAMSGALGAEAFGNRLAGPALGLTSTNSEGGFARPEGG